MAYPDYQAFVAQVKAADKDFNCEGMYCFVNKKCKKVEASLQDLRITLDQTVYSVPAYGYLIEGAGGANCSIQVSYLGILADSYVLGDTFIKNFYASFNYANKTIGLAENSNGPVSFLPPLTWGAWLGISLGGLMTIILIIVGIFYLKGRGKNSQPNQPEASEALVTEEEEDLNVKIAHNTLIEQ